jgi:hypothetical protein
MRAKTIATAVELIKSFIWEICKLGRLQSKAKRKHVDIHAFIEVDINDILLLYRMIFFSSNAPLRATYFNEFIQAGISKIKQKMV